jgi:DNA helicase HerA-like ATPase
MVCSYSHKGVRLKNPIADSSTGIFWIFGKPGSGKSTLMKYLVEDQRTHDLLQKWAGPKKLIVRKFCCCLLYIHVADARIY